MTGGRQAGSQAGAQERRLASPGRPDQEQPVGSVGIVEVVAEPSQRAREQFFAAEEPLVVVGSVGGEAAVGRLFRNRRVARDTQSDERLDPRVHVLDTQLTQHVGEDVMLGGEGQAFGTAPARQRGCAAADCGRQRPQAAPGTLPQVRQQHAELRPRRDRVKTRRDVLRSLSHQSAPLPDMQPSSALPGVWSPDQVAAVRGCTRSAPTAGEPDRVVTVPAHARGTEIGHGGAWTVRPSVAARGSATDGRCHAWRAPADGHPDRVGLRTLLVDVLHLPAQLGDGSGARGRRSRRWYGRHHVRTERRTAAVRTCPTR